MKKVLPPERTPGASGEELGAYSRLSWAGEASGSRAEKVPEAVLKS